ncbi:MAG: phosphomannomutase/phosphoglucomutase [Gemmatimonadaceae bacterium]|nr:phosphomannomutase/phosphoglucomutase [Gemmatimonadaceae bacterium]NUO94098.1 phosphomannomutase/phosphoglucomutase [Gemmatimonadaceae bacterium]NUR35661.1 phosphomannomutase/phosphoglucomutase [Gemmatimonadaceae bacterium]NUS33304.1 phosphomannomutase/phosphoglucomutase [Gemmatimonadaceae bacterium]NUS46653.1 phosphomannomutase/phosphoglucomutase [Gemmatimonadaceae bacterium]
MASGIFRQYDVRGIVGRDLTAEVAHALGGAYAALLKERGVSGEVAVGRDNRPSGTMLRDALVQGLTEAGVSVVDIDVVPTPLLYWSLHHLPVVGGIQITGSHNPAEYNGFKLSFGTGSLHGEDIQRLLALIRADAAPKGGPPGRVRREQVIDRYVADVAARIGKISRPMKVVYDCGNGAGALVAPQLMRALGLNAVGLFTESDGTFPNHHPDPTVPENLEDLVAAVKRERAEIGLAFDGDADRIGMVDGEGRIVWGDHILILYARDVLARAGAGQPIIFDVKCSQALPDEIRKAGGTPIMWKTGHSLIKEKMKETRAPLAGEMSGHMFFTEGFYGHDDALYGAARLLRIVADSGRPVRELLANVPEFVSTPEIRVDCDDRLKFEIVQRAVDHFRSRHDVIDVDGVRVLYGDGWGLIRASNTQPIIVTRFEARTAARLAEIRGEMEGWLRQQGAAV